MSENILVTGATGKVSRELFPRLLDAGAGVIAATRHPERARELFPDDAEVVELDYQRTDTWDQAVHWADRVFLAPAPFDPRAYETLVPFLDWAVQSSTRHLVLLTAMTVERVDELALRKVEEHLAETGIDHTFLRPNWLMQNFSEGYVQECVVRDGAISLSGGDGKVSFVDVRDVADVAARVLTSEEWIGRSPVLTGPEALDHAEAAAVNSEDSGRDVEYHPVDDEVMRTILRERGRSDDEIRVILDLYASMRDGWRAGVTDDVESILGRPPTTFRQFARDQAEAWA